MKAVTQFLLIVLVDFLTSCLRLELKCSPKTRLEISTGIRISYRPGITWITHSRHVTQSLCIYLSNRSLSVLIREYVYVHQFACETFYKIRENYYPIFSSSIKLLSTS